MEPLTQALLGAAVAQAAAGRALGRRAALWGALVGMSPDLDVIVGGLRNGFGEMLYHRGTTHALWFGPVVGPALGWLLWRWRDPERSTPLRAWQWLAVLALFTHPVLDAFTPYGTQFFAPFWRVRIAWHGIGIIDPFYTVPLGVTVYLARRVADDPVRSARRASVGLAATTAYLLVGVGLNVVAEREVRTLLSEGGADVRDVRAYPTGLQPFLRRVVVDQADQEVFVGWHTTLRRHCAHGEPFTRMPRDARMEAFDATFEGTTFRWFALGDVVFRVTPADGDTYWLALDDLRYGGGFANPPDRGMWGVRARHDASGRRIGPIERYRAGFGASTPFGALFAATAGDFSELPRGETTCAGAAAHLSG